MDGEAKFVPKSSKAFNKFLRNEELDALKLASVESNKLWKMAGKPRSGPIFDKRQKAHVQYRKRIRECETQSTSSYTNELHEALLKKNGTVFWKCWRSNFEPKSKCVEVGNCVDPGTIAQKFAEHFEAAYAPNNPDRVQVLQSINQSINQKRIRVTKVTNVTARPLLQC